MEEADFRYLQSRYVQSTIAATYEGNTFPFFIKDVVQSKGNVLFHGTAYHEGSLLTKNLNYDFLKIHNRPKSLVYDSNNEVILFRLTPARQWKKGLTDGNTIFTNVLADLSLDKEIRHSGGRGGWMELCFMDVIRASLSNKDEYLGITNAITLLSTSDKLATTVTKEYWISYGVFNDDFTLWRFDFPVANFVGNSVTTIDNLFYQEVVDLFHRLGEFKYDISRS